MGVLLDRLEVRRKQLRMSYPALAKRSGLSVATVRRILANHYDRASFSNVAAVARALGVEFALRPMVPEYTFVEQQAHEKARRLVGLVQASSGLEAQAVDEATVNRMVSQTVHDLMAGSRSRIWEAV